jgi:hypothetical protein
MRIQVFTASGTNDYSLASLPLDVEIDQDNKIYSIFYFNIIKRNNSYENNDDGSNANM